MIGQPVELSVVAGTQEGSGSRFGAYERLLGDAIAGDTTLFARQDVVEAAWAIVDPILNVTSPLYHYERATWGPSEADRLASAIGGWTSTKACEPESGS
jgi:glucose-6-phosphate 1-dehydrogenase